MIWRWVADVWLGASLYIGWIVSCMATVEHWGWNIDLMSTIALAPAVLIIVVHVFAIAFVRAYEKARND